MNESNRNTRTLIVSFLIAVMLLVPLRFVEIGQVVNQGQKQVLGEMTVKQEEATPTAVLEAPYDTIESQTPTCITTTDIDSAWAELRSEVEGNQISQVQASEMMANLTAAEKNICK